MKHEETLIMKNNQLHEVCPCKCLQLEPSETCKFGIRLCYLMKYVFMKVCVDLNETLENFSKSFLVRLLKNFLKTKLTLIHFSYF